MKRIVATLGLFGLLVLGLSACTSQSGPENAGATPAAEATAAVTETTQLEPTKSADAGMTDVMKFEPAESGGELVYGQVQECAGLYIYGTSQLACSHITNHLYEGIDSLNYEYQPVIFDKLPMLEDPASGAKLETVKLKDGDKYVDPESQEVMTATVTTTLELPQLTVPFKMKPGLTWQDGTPVTADDSVFSHDLGCDDKSSQGSKYTCERTASYTKVDDQTVEWKGLPGFTDQTYYIDFYTPLPRQQIGSSGKRMDETPRDKIIEDEIYNQKPYSYGPFMIEEYVPKDHVTLVPNPHYWRAKEGLPFLKKFIHKFYADNNAMVAAVKSGDADVVGGLEITQFDALEEASAAGELVADYKLGTSWEHIDFNLNPSDDRPAFGACTEIRHAMMTGYDRQRAVDTILKGKSKVQNSFLNDEHWAYPKEAGYLPDYKFDPDAAKKMLEDAGWTDSDKDKVREASKDMTCSITVDVSGKKKDFTIPKGTKLQMKLITTQGNQMREQNTLLFQSNMGDLGIKVDLEYQPAAVLFAPAPDGPMKSRKYDLVEFGWLTGSTPSPNLYYCSEIPTAENGWSGQNNTGWCNPAFDKAGKTADTTLKRADSLPLYHETQKLFMEELPVMTMFTRVKIEAMSPDVVNVMPNASVNSETYNSATWGFKPGSGRGSKTHETGASSAVTDTTGVTATNKVTP